MYLFSPSSIQLNCIVIVTMINQIESGILLKPVLEVCILHLAILPGVQLLPRIFFGCWTGIPKVLLHYFSAEPEKLEDVAIKTVYI